MTSIDELIEEHKKATRECAAAKAAGQWIAQVLLGARIAELEMRILDFVELNEGWA